MLFMAFNIYSHHCSVLKPLEPLPSLVFAIFHQIRFVDILWWAFMTWLHTRWNLHSEGYNEDLLVVEYPHMLDIGHSHLCGPLVEGVDMSIIIGWPTEDRRPPKELQQEQEPEPQHQHASDWVRCRRLQHEDPRKELKGNYAYWEPP